MDIVIINKINRRIVYFLIMFKLADTFKQIFWESMCQNKIQNHADEKR